MDYNYNSYIGKIIDNRYIINKIIGAGGMAIVFEATDNVMQRTVAVKMLKTEIAKDQAAVRRFINESKAVSMLSHPNIVSILDVSVQNNLKYIVMEMVDGITLKNYISKKGVLSFRETVRFSEQILMALEHAHSKGIIHRDIKPQNIMLMRNGQIKVTDFGIAKLPNAETLTMTDKAIGTVYYISPEQASGKPIDARSDIYSLGIVMYEMATGSLPFDAENPVSVAMKQINDRPTPPRTLNRDIPEGLEQIILGAMEKDPAGRFQTATQMLRYIAKLKSDPDFVFRTAHSGNENSFVNRVTDPRGSKTVKNSHGITVANPRASFRKQSRTMFPVVCGVFTAFMLIMIISGYLVLARLLEAQTNNRPMSVTVPSLVGAVCNSELLEQFDSSVYDVKVVYKVDYTYSSGTIIAQEPSGGSKRNVIANEQLCEIELTVSSGAESIVLGDYTIENYRAAEIELKSLGLTPNVVNVSSDTIDTGYIVRTEPAAGTSIVLGSSVTLYVSVGSEYTSVTVPDFIGKTAEKAYRMMKASNGELLYKVGEIKYEYSDDYVEGEIIYQTKSSGTSVPKGTAIGFTISLGSEKSDETDGTDEASDESDDSGNPA